MDQRLFWTALTRFHDWSDKGFARHMIERATEAGAIGELEWISTKPGEKRPAKIDHRSGIPEFVIGRAKPQRKSKIISFDAGGTKPFEWKLSLHLPPFLPDAKRVWGFGTIAIETSRELFSGAERSGHLIDAFLATHTPDNTEYACIHPYARLQAMRDTVYRNAVTVTPMFAGVYWANFLGPGHIDQFDRDKLADLSAYKLEWRGARGLFIIMSPDIADADSAAVESSMQRMTGIFRSALAA